MKSIGFLEKLQHQVVGRHKTETRRLTDPQPDDYLLNPRGDFILPDGSRADLLYRFHLIRPRYKVGEIIYIKEPYIDDLDPDRVFIQQKVGVAAARITALILQMQSTVDLPNVSTKSKVRQW